MNENSHKDSSHRSTSKDYKQKTTGDKQKIDTDWQELLPYLNLESNSEKHLLEAIDRTLSKSREEDQRRYLEEAERLIEFDDEEYEQDLHQVKPQYISVPIFKKKIMAFNSSSILDQYNYEYCSFPNHRQSKNRFLCVYHKKRLITYF